jgi:uncharacterized membrane protein
MAEPFHGYGWGSHLAIHFTPILFLMVPFYLVLRGPLFLLYVQVFAVGLAAIPLYLLAKEKLPGKYPAGVVAVSFLLFRPLLNGMMYDFHPEMFFPLFIFTGYYCLTIKKSDFLFFTCMLLALFIKEDFAIYVFFFCLWMMRSPEYRKTALWAGMASVIYIALAFIFFIPYFRKQVEAASAYEFMSRWQDYGSNFRQIAGKCLSHPLRLLRDLNWLPNLARLGNYILPLIFLPLFDPIVLLVLPPCLVAWLSRIPLMSSFGLYYGAPLLTFLFLALLHALARLNQASRKGGSFHPAKFTLILNLLLFLALVNFKWNLLAPAEYRHIREYAAIHNCLEQIPEQASLAAQSALIPHISKRRSIAMLPETRSAEYIVLHRGLNPWPLNKTQLHEWEDSLQRSAKYRCLCSSGGLRLYQKIGSRE